MITFTNEEKQEIKAAREKNRYKNVEKRLEALELRAEEKRKRKPSLNHFAKRQRQGNWYQCVTLKRHIRRQSVIPSVPCHHIREYQYAYGAVEAALVEIRDDGFEAVVGNSKADNAKMQDKEAVAVKRKRREVKLI